MIAIRRHVRAPTWPALACALLTAAPAGAAVLPTVREAGGTYGVRVLSYKEMPFRTVVHQERDFSCGSAALATLLRYHFGRPVDEAEIFQKMWEKGDKAKIQKVGFSLLDMKTYLTSIGLDADGFRVPLEALLAKEAPSIVVLKTGAYMHFVVLKGVRDGQVLLGDPAFGLKTVPVADFAKSWQGVAFLIHGPADVEAAAYNRRQDWAALPRPALDMASRAQPSASALVRDLPPIYQLTSTFHVTP